VEAFGRAGDVDAGSAHAVDGYSGAEDAGLAYVVDGYFGAEGAGDADAEVGAGVGSAEADVDCVNGPMIQELDHEGDWGDNCGFLRGGSDAVELRDVGFGCEDFDGATFVAAQDGVFGSHGSVHGLDVDYYHDTAHVEL
jgi:hypothetical protein